MIQNRTLSFLISPDKLKKKTLIPEAGFKRHCFVQTKNSLHAIVHRYVGIHTEKTAINSRRLFGEPAFIHWYPVCQAPHEKSFNRGHEAGPILFHEITVSLTARGPLIPFSISKVTRSPFNRVLKPFLLISV